jgi:hypothetical protein
MEMSDENWITKRDEVRAEHLLDQAPPWPQSGMESLDQKKWAWEGGRWCSCTGPSHWNHLGVCKWAGALCMTGLPGLRVWHSPALLYELFENSLSRYSHQTNG